MSRQWPILIPFVSMAAGLALSAHTDYCCTSLTLAAGFVCLLLSCLLRNSLVFSGCVAVFFFIWGMTSLAPWLSPDAASISIRSYASDSPLVVEGIVAGRPVASPDGGRIAIKVERLFFNKRHEPVRGNLLLYVAGGDITLERGDRIRFSSRIHIPRLLGLPGEFDYPRFLAFQAISVTGRVVSQQDIVLIRGAAEESVQRRIDRAARLLGDAIRSAFPNQNTSSVLGALLIGDQKRIPQPLADAYSRAGVNHILSISGFHVGILATVITFIVWHLLKLSSFLALHFNLRRSVLLLALPVMLAYLFLTGAAPATARSVIMLAVCVLALYAERESDPVNTLLLAAFLLISINPPTLFDVSFQLSFISLWGLVIAVPPVLQLFPSVASPYARGFLQFVTASVVASSVTMIPVLFIFKVASLNGIVTNFLIVPLLGYGAVIAGFAVLPLLLVFPHAAPAVLWPAATMVEVSNRIITSCASLPVIRFHGITAVDMAYFLAFLCCVTFVRSTAWRRILAVCIPLAALTTHLGTLPRADGKLHVTMLSVGQAESILLRLPDGSSMLVDGGGYLHDTGNDFGQRVLAPALGALGVGRVDRIIVTHEHPDHIGGLAFIIRNFPVGEIWTTEAGAAAALFRDVSEIISKQKILRRTLSAGDTITLPGGVLLQVLSPGRRVNNSTGYSEKSVNEDSLVFRLSYRAFSMLFTADAGFDAERQIIETGRELSSTVLKIGHHGSRYSTSEPFLERVQPRMALVSAGFGNRFGLPSRRTLDLLQTKNISLYRTDRDGTLQIVTDGAGWSVSTPYTPK
ncbi:MAG: DNA internalization-related competence protein ComEC/Rec2 [Desulfuromonadales bacterium]